MRPRIFISYRRATASGIAHTISTFLESKLGTGSVFIDNDSIGHGEDFEVAIESALQESGGLILILDESWMPNERGRVEKLFDVDDYVRKEVSYFLQRELPILPVFFGEVETMPSRNTLPECLGPLCKIHGIRISFEGFHRDRESIYKFAKKIVTPPQRKIPISGSLIGAMCIIGLAVLAYNYWWATTDPFRTLSYIEALALDPGEVFRECKNCPSMVVVPSGTFSMGSPKEEIGLWQDGREEPQIEVEIPIDFAISETQVTVKQFRAFVEESGLKIASGCRSHVAGAQGQSYISWVNPGFEQGDNHPVVCVSWQDARKYLRWLSATTGADYRLPTESEWEYAARAGSDTPFFFGEQYALLCEHGNVFDRKAVEAAGGGRAYCVDGYAYTAPVRSFAPNNFGVYDMIGNVWEWVQDCWIGDHSKNPANGQPVFLKTCSVHTLKGGDWVGLPSYTRSASRHFYGQTARGDNVGFRVVRSIR